MIPQKNHPDLRPRALFKGLVPVIPIIVLAVAAWLASRPGDRVVPGQGEMGTAPVSGPAGGVLFPSTGRGVPTREWISSGWKNDEDPVLSAFARWCSGYLGSSPAGRRLLEEEGTTLAAERRERMKALFSSDPRRALANAVPEHLRGELPAEVAALLERPVHAFGDLVTEYRCDDRPTERNLAIIGGETYLSHLYGSRRHFNYYLGTSIHGIVLDDEIAVLDGPLQSLGQARVRIGDREHPVPAATPIEEIERAITALDAEGNRLEAALRSKGLDRTFGDFIYAMSDSGLSATDGYPQRRSTEHTHGGKKILILRLKASGDSWPESETEAVFQNWSYSASGWDTRLRLSTYGKTWLETVDVTPILTLPQPASYYVTTGSSGTNYDSGKWANDGEAAARAAGYNPNDYFCVVVCTRYFDGGGIGWAAGKRIWVNGAFDNFAALMNHEFGHTLGLPHASSWHSGDGNPISPNRSHVEYGDENDPMGNGGKTFANTYQAYFKSLGRWMPDGAVETVTQDGIYTVWQDDGQTDLNRTLALKLGRSEGILYWISVRGDLVRTNRQVDQSNFLNGVSIVAVSPGENPHTLDIDNPGDGNRRNSPLALNRSWRDTVADITFRTVEVGGANPNRYAKVQITFGPSHGAGYRPLVSGGIYRFRNRHNGKYLTIPGNTSANATRVQVANLNTANNSQLWTVWRDARGYYNLNHYGTDKWLDVQSNSSADRASIWQYNRSGTGDDAQNWNVFQTEAGSVLLLHRGTEGKLMEMDVNTQAVHQMGSTGTNWQQWYPELVGISPGTYRLLPRVAQTQALEIGHPSPENGNVAARGAWLGYANQQWVVSSLANGRIRLSPAHAPGKALDVEGSGSADGTAIRQRDWSESTAQRWSLTPLEGSWMRFTPDCAPSASLDARGAAAGAAVALAVFDGSQSQQWRFADADPNIVESPYQLWARSQGLSGDEAEPDFDPTGAGGNNLLRFALAATPSLIPQPTPSPEPLEEGATLIAAVRAGAGFAVDESGRLSALLDGVRYEVQGSWDLADWSATVEALSSLPAHALPALPEGWEYRAFRLGGEGASGFLRVVVKEE